MKIEKILIDKKFLEYIEKRNLKKQFDKALQFILGGKGKLVDFRLRKPKHKKVYYFRINNQYRAFAKIKDNLLEVIDINDHQNNK